MSRTLRSLFIASIVLIVVMLILHVVALTGHMRLTFAVVSVLIGVTLGVFFLTERALRSVERRRRQSLLAMARVIWRWTPRVVVVALVAVLVYGNWRWFATMPVADFASWANAGRTEQSTPADTTRKERLERGMLESDGLPVILLFFAGVSCAAAYGGLRRGMSAED